ncbi:hypothetical protein [Xylanimonas sp. McL0601]|uniref:hypothetical protein n=1 Tax=Xylanimonas sp. McL0601 TaxID=3414739 RepID=UPI003CEF2C19
MATVAITTAPAISASAASCSPGFACGWSANAFTGTQKSFYLNTEYWADYGFSNQANGIWANGTSCGQTRFYDSEYALGNYILLKSQSIYGTSYHDDVLDNGSPLGSGNTGDWDDKISTSWFTECNW